MQNEKATIRVPPQRLLLRVNGDLSGNGRLNLGFDQFKEASAPPWGCFPEPCCEAGV